MGRRTTGPHFGGIGWSAGSVDRYQGERTHDVQGLEPTEASSKKKTLHATERDTPEVKQARQEYRCQAAACPFERLKFVDESGLNIAMTRRYGRAPRGERVHDPVPENFGRNVTIIGALSCHGLEAVMTVDAATDADVFRAYVTHVLAPSLEPDDIVVMDNLSAHKVPGIETTIQATGAKLLFRQVKAPSEDGGRPFSAIATRHACPSNNIGMR
jgi:hypothetical protein